MKSKKELLKNSRLYVIIDKKICAESRRSIVNAAYRLKEAGVNLIQFRDKESKKETVLKVARRLRKILNKNFFFIINDHLDVAKIIDCDGIHLGQDDASPEIARKILGPDKIIGVSCHNLKEAKEAEEAGADYISIGVVFRTEIKPGYKPMGLNYVKMACNKIKIPFYVIGGINERNAQDVYSCGAKRIAVCRAVCKAGNIRSAIKKLHPVRKDGSF